MSNPGDKKPKKVLEEKHLHDVSSERENIPTTPISASSSSSSPTSNPTIIQGGQEAPVEEAPVSDQDSTVVAGGSGSETSSKKAAAGKGKKVNTAHTGGDVKIVQKKRGRKPLDPGASSSTAGDQQKKPRRRKQLLELPSGPPICYICNQNFMSWKAVFGHMRKHKVGEERARGAFPPPVFTPPDGASPGTGGGGATADVTDYDLIHQELAPVLLDLAHRVFLFTSPRPDGLDIDLNRPVPSSDHEEEGRFDLNKPPPEEKDEDDKNMDGGGAAI